jgi:hypothetical protein
MITIRATQKLLNIQKLKPAPIVNSEESAFGEWFAHTISSSFRGKNLVLYVNYPSLVTVITVGKTIKTTFPHFKQRFLALTKRHNFPEKFINDVFQKFNDLTITKTNSRSMVAYTNQIAEQIAMQMLTYQTFDEIDLDEEENMVMDHLFGNGKNSYFMPNSYWHFYLKGEDPFTPPASIAENQCSIKLIPDDNKLSRSENLHMENQLMKIQIEDILGGKIMGNNNNQIPAEIENLFLKNIIEFEKNVKTSNLVTINEILGKPKLKPAATLSEKQLKEELKKTIHLLHKNFIHVDFLGDYSDMVKYKFLSEELLTKETQQLNIPGMITHFIYEEFHPNHELDFKEKINEFIHNLIFSSELQHEDAFTHFCTEPFLLNNESIELTELYKKAKVFALIHNEEDIKEYKKTAITVDLEVKKIATVTGILTIKTDAKKLKCPMVFHFKHIDNDWVISGLEFSELY